MVTLDIDTYFGWQLHWRTLELEYDVVRAIEAARVEDEAQLLECRKQFLYVEHRLMIAIHEAGIMFGEHHAANSSIKLHTKYAAYSEEYNKAKNMLLRFKKSSARVWLDITATRLASVSAKVMSAGIRSRKPPS